MSIKLSSLKIGEQLACWSKFDALNIVEVVSHDPSPLHRALAYFRFVDRPWCEPFVIWEWELRSGFYDLQRLLPCPEFPLELASVESELRPLAELPALRCRTLESRDGNALALSNTELGANCALLQGAEVICRH